MSVVCLACAKSHLDRRSRQLCTAPTFCPPRYCRVSPESARLAEKLSAWVWFEGARRWSLGCVRRLLERF